MRSVGPISRACHRIGGIADEAGSICNITVQANGVAAAGVPSNR